MSWNRERLQLSAINAAELRAKAARGNASRFAQQAMMEQRIYGGKQQQRKGKSMWSFLRRRKELEIDIEKLELKLRNEREKLQQEFDKRKNTQDLEYNKRLHNLELENKEIQTLSKLRIEQEIAKIRLESDNRLKDLQVKHAEELAAVKAESAKEHYDKLSKAMVELNLEGSAQTKFVQDMALTMMGKGEKLSLPSTQHTLIMDKKE